ncbi:putative undecaprenyl diphosphate synthase-domain-containing protein [Cladochytrium replicatum]|nr:putative undecaprenyl diphosphate synthase-domain-containing protein [Cladochytrium replicatum]
MESLPSFNPNAEASTTTTPPHPPPFFNTPPHLLATFLLSLLVLIALFILTTTPSSRVDYATKILRLGPVPRHVGFIMDGNRRYARSRGVKTRVGHEDGFKALEKILEACLKLGVEVVTVYAFSIENFKRKEEEVETLMSLFREKLYELAENEDLVHRYGVSVRLIGAVEMLRDDVREAANKLTESTQHNTRAILNVACPYTSRHEITTAISRAAAAAPTTRTITSRDIGSQLFTSTGPKLDLLVRTSGEMRLSDFMLWQSACEDAELHFVQVYWPQFSFWDMVPIWVGYQARRVGKEGRKGEGL